MSPRNSPDRDQRAPKSDLMLAHDVLAITYAAYWSAEQGRRIDLRPFLRS